MCNDAQNAQSGTGTGGGTCPSFYKDCYKAIKSDPVHPQRRLDELRWGGASDTHAVNGIMQRSQLHGAPW